jgi:molecular chaperone GrpE (heat shock protein)
VLRKYRTNRMVRVLKELLKMKKAFLLIGLILLMGGGGALWWVTDEIRDNQHQTEARKLDNSSQTQDFLSRFDQWMQMPEQKRIQTVLWADSNGVPMKESEIAAEQKKRLEADIDKLALGVSGVESYADLLYGSNWRKAVDDYKQKLKQNELIFTCSVVCTSLGGAVTILMLLVFIGGLFAKIFRKQKDSKTDVVSARSGSSARRSLFEEMNYQHQDFRSFGKKSKDDDFAGIMRHPHDNHSNRPDAESAEKPLEKQSNEVVASSSSAEVTVNKAENKTDSKQEVAINSQTIIAESRKEHAFRRRINAGLSKQTGSAGHEKSRAAEHQVSGNSDSQEKGKPANPALDTLMELTQQVSAIREYAANQQSRLNRFQDGYDWNIIKNFCLRIIRCIDNIESRMFDLAGQDEDTFDLEQIRDELVFALESSGVERFEPELKSDYKGQEKFAEALKDKCSSEDADMKGKIEKVIRPGYQCYIDEQNIRVVRPAQVRLYA